MTRFRARAAVATAITAASLVLTLHGQVAGVRALQITDVGLPAVEEGVVWDVNRAPQMPQALGRTEFAHLGGVVGASGREYTPGRVIVRFRDGLTADERRSVMRLATPSGEMMPRREHADFDVIRIDEAEDAEAVAARFAERLDVVYAQAAYRVHAMTPFVPNDPDYARLQWNLPLINMERAWEIQPQAASTVTVAVVDTGMAYRAATLTANIPAFTNRGVRYPALGTQTIPFAAAPQLVGGGNTSRIVSPYDAISRGINPPLDLDGHGTHVSGTIGQLTNDGIGLAGIAFNARLMPVKVLGGFWDVVFGSAPFQGGSDDDVAAGLRYAADNGAKVINMSLGSSGPPDCGTNPNRSGCSPVIEAAMRYAVGKGAFVVVAGGNEFEDFVPPFGTNPTSVLAEIASRINGAISVAAVDPNKARSFYSSTGTYIEIAAPGGSNRGFPGSSGFVFQQTFNFNFVETFDPTVVPPSQYAAPRFDILANIGYIGTSMAAPHISGVAAMLIQQGITDPAAIEAAIEQTALDLGTPGRDDQYGFGLVDARAALRGLGLAR